MALIFALMSSVEELWHGSLLELTGWVQVNIEASATVRPSFMRALEASRAARSDAERALMVSLFCLCRDLKSGAETRKVAECITRVGRGDVLVEWFQGCPEAFPKQQQGEPQNAFAWLLVADAAAEGDYRVVLENVIGEGPVEQWGELLFLRHFYEGRLMRERDQEERSLVDRERELLAQASVSEAERCATVQWQRDVLAELADKYVSGASR